ncbi:MAG: BamA/TamA family outer membrane protein [Ignavibacteriaceae bacterium]
MKLYLAVLILMLIISPVSSIIFAQPGELYELSSIDFIGNDEFSDSDLRNIIQSKENPFWLWKFFDSFTPFGSPPVYFDSLAITVDIVSLKSFYAVNGFFETSISYSYDVDTSSKSVVLTYNLSESSEFTYGKINVYGLNKLEYLNSQIMPYTNLSNNERFNQEKLQRHMGYVLSILKNNGYMLATFDSTLILMDTLMNKTDLEIYFTPGNKYIFDEIRVEKSGEGKDLVSDNLIKYVASIEVGQMYNEEEIAKSRLRLARTGLFNSINLKGVIEDTVSNNVPLKINGNIGSMNDLSPEVFIDNEFNTSNIGIGLSYSRKNFFGDARKLTLSTKFKVNDIQNFNFFSSTDGDSIIQTQVDVRLLLEQPFFFSRGISASLEAYYKTYNIFETRFENEGGRLNLAIDMPVHTFINLLNPYLNLDILGYDIFSEINDLLLVTTPKSTTAILGTAIGSTTANDFFFPFKGYNLNQILELALTRTVATFSGPYIQDSVGVNEVRTDDIGFYYKLQTIFSNYMAVARDNNTVFGMKFKIGYIQTFVGGDGLVPPNQTFFAGGANSVRGWRARELVPENRIPFIGVTNPAEDNIRGGTFILEGSFEFRRKFNPDFGYALFLDYGNTWNGYKGIQLDQIALAIGFGLRYYSPFAPFRIDFGWKLWDPQNQISLFERAFWQAFEFHFGIGEAF